jgi:hypothetical protein
VSGHLSVQSAWPWVGAKVPGCGLILKLIANSAVKCWSGMDGVANRAGEWKIFKSITFSGGAI